ncbi:MAG: hypothetical protein AAGA92_00055 [Planctomycetota bacterium]
MPTLRLKHAASLAAVIALFTTNLPAAACPFCSSTSQTLTEEMASMDVAVIAELIEPAEEIDLDAPLPEGPPDPDAGMATFRVTEAIKGGDLIAAGEEFRAVYFGQAEDDKSFLISGLAPDAIQWNMPLPLTTQGVEYVQSLGGLPEKGADRLAFFQEHFESEDPLLAQDAYDEFARAPYQEVIDLGPRMNRPQLVAWINDPEVGPTRRRLYLTMLGICGGPDDADMLERLLRNDYREAQPAVKAAIALAGANGAALGMPLIDDLLRADERRRKQCLDALIAAFLKLRGPSGMDLIDERLLANPDAEYTQVYAAIMALRFHGQETEDIPKERLLESVRLLLDNGEIAEQVVPDLARWGDWSVLDRLVNLFRESKQDAWIRQPVASYLLVAEEQGGEIAAKATTALEELEELDPKCVKRARQYSAFALVPRAAAGNPAAAADSKSPSDQTTATSGAPNAQPSKKTQQPIDPPSTVAIVGIPLLAGLLLMGVYTLLLRAVDLRTSET